MDTLRGNFDDGIDPLDGAIDPDTQDDELGREDPPAAIGTDERRMQVRAYNHWAGLLEDRSFPSIEDLDPQALPDFGPYSVLLDFSTGVENPGISYLGSELAKECDANHSTMQKLDDVPSRSLLTRITDHYMQILANQAPIGFEAEFVNQRGQTILYRGILLPFSSDDDTIDFIYGIINWKELADAATADELLLQIDQALGRDHADDNDMDDEITDEADSATGSPEPLASEELTDWADGPAASVGASAPPATDALPLPAQDDAAVPGSDRPVDDLGLPLPAYGTQADDASADDDDLDYAPDSDFALEEFDEEPVDENEEYGELDEDGDDDSFASLTEHMSGLGIPRAKKTATELGFVQSEADDSAEAGSDSEFDLTSYGLSDDEIIEEDGAENEIDESNFGSLGSLLGNADALNEDDILGSKESRDESAQDESAFDTLSEALEPANAQAVPAENDAAIADVRIDAADMELSDWLAVAREQAETARNREDRSRAALYKAVGRAYDFAIAATAAPDDFAELVADSGLTVQDRAPMTPIVKLVFGADYDKTRLTEYAAVLGHATRVGLEQGALANYLGRTQGGLKAVVAAERAWRREQDGKPVKPKRDISPALARKLRALPLKDFDALSPDGEEFALVAIRRLANGTVAVLGEVEHDTKILAKAMRSLVG